MVAETIDMSAEVWKDVPGMERYYQVSNYGRIGSFYSCAGNWAKLCDKRKILKPRRNDKYGHLSVQLYKENKIHRLQIHRLVLEAFVGPCPPGMECRHLDGNPANNRLDNLRWGTHSENQFDRTRHGTQANPTWLDNRGEKCFFAKLNEWQVRIIKRLFEISDMTDSEIAEIFHVNRKTINNIRNNKTWKHI